MPRGRPRWIEDLDKEQLITLWYDDSLTAAEIAMELGVSASWLSANRERLGLPERMSRREIPIDDPTPEEIAERCAEIRERRLKAKAEYGDVDPTPYRTTCLAWDGVRFQVRTA